MASFGLMYSSAVKLSDEREILETLKLERFGKEDQKEH
jgi:hypothetical protein